MTPRIELTRGGQVEAVHPYSAVAVRGVNVVARVGPPIGAAWRSAAKPFQLWCSLEALEQGQGGAMLRGGLSDQELAIGAASHAGQPEHVRLVRGLLRRFGLIESDLRCGAHAPLYRPAHEALIRGGLQVSDIHNNCSGKHAFMRAACVAQGWETDYREPTHPLQRRIVEVLTDWCGQAPGLGVDGCGVPTFLLPISAMARAWSALAEAVDGGDPRLGQVGRAMGAHPHLTSGAERLDEAVMSGAKEQMVVKIGAKGLFCIALPKRGLGLAIKVHSGGEEALGEAVAETLAELAPGAFMRPGDWEWDKVRNVVGEVVGDRRRAAG